MKYCWKEILLKERLEEKEKQENLNNANIDKSIILCPHNEKPIVNMSKTKGKIENN